MREPPAQRSIALVDDDRNILTSVAIALEAEGYRVRAFADPVEALGALAAEPADLAVLDIKMPRLDGLELLTQLRRRTRMPVIFLTSKDDEQDERVGLELGADDYIKKPFSVQLLIARIRALLRRVDLARAPVGEEAAMEASEKVIHRGALALNPARHLCTWRDLPVALTVTEFLIVQALAQRPGLVKNRNQLMDAAYDDQIYVDDRTIDSHIKRIRRKFREVDPAFAGIETLYGIGYRYKDA